MRDRFVSQQVRILLERMDMYPEEFANSAHLGLGSFNNKWDYVLQSGEFNNVELFLIKRKIKNIRRKATQEAIMSTIMYDESDQRQGELSLDKIERATRALQNAPRMRLRQK